MRAERETDVCLVGLGGTGGMAAAALTAAGMHVVALEAGPPRTGREHLMDEIASSNARNVWGAAKFNHEIPTWRPNATSDRRPTPHTQRLANGVGGSSLVYGAISFRFHPDDFRARSNTVARYGTAALPPGSALVDWPLGYDDLEPYYDLTERLVGVSGLAGNVGGALLPGGNPFEGPRRRPYPLPPLRASGLGQLFRDAALREGYHPFPVPATILTEPYDGRAACTYCSFCNRLACHVNAKGSTLVTLLPRALATGRLEIRTGCRALRVVSDGRGVATGVEYAASDGVHVQPAHIVILATYSYENVRLLLLSQSTRFPNGLGNNAGQVGRYYMARQHLPVFGTFERHELNSFAGPAAQGFTIDDLNANNFDHAGAGFVRGGRIAVVHQFPPIESTVIVPPDVPRWGRAYKAHVARYYRRTAVLTVGAETLPYEANFLDLDPDVRDPFGRPVIRITFDTYDNERRLLSYLQDRAVRLLEGMGADRVWRAGLHVEAMGVHDVGGARMGVDPARSVVDGVGRLHEAPNVYVLGGATLPTHGGLNPTLTLQALALRTAAHIAGVSPEALAMQLGAPAVTSPA
jgi:gluconate 2-dehydrogenase alpha chain